MQEITTQKINHFLKSFKINAICDFIEENNADTNIYIKNLLGNKISSLRKILPEFELEFQITNNVSLEVLSDLGLIKLQIIKPRENTLNFLDIYTKFSPAYKLPLLLGQTINNENYWIDLDKCPHLLIAGTTGSGKSISIHNIISNLLMYSNCKLYLVDPKYIELSKYSELNINVYSSYSETLELLNYLSDLMESRYEILRSYKVQFEPVVCIIDEFGDLILQDSNKELHNKLCKLAQKCRAANIHLILATQRPSVNIISGTIKANFPTRLAFKTSSSVDSRVILDSNGAENLNRFW